MSRLAFPGPALLAQLRENGKIEYVFDSIADILAGQIAKGAVDSQALQIVQGYLRQIALGAVDDPSKRLRKVVYFLVFQQQIARHSAVETLWDIVLVFGEHNFHVVIRYLDETPPVMRPKMARLLTHLASQSALGSFPHNELGKVLEKTLLDRVGMAVRVVLSSSYSEILQREWLDTLKTKTPPGNAIYYAADYFNVPDDVKALRTIFPQLSITRATALLKEASLESVTQQLVENPSLMNPPKTKKTYTLLTEETRHQQAAKDAARARVKTLALAQRFADDEEPDLDFDQPAREVFSEADRKVLAVEHALYKVFERDPERLTEKHRRSPERERLRASTGMSNEQIEHWASVLVKDPKRLDAMRVRFEMHGDSLQQGQHRANVWSSTRPPTREGTPVRERTPQQSSAASSNDKSQAKPSSQPKPKPKSKPGPTPARSPATESSTKTHANGKTADDSKPKSKSGPRKNNHDKSKASAKRPG